MSKQALRTTLSTLLVPLIFTTGCGDAETSEADSEINEHIELTSVEITSEDDLYLLHPLHVAVEAELLGEAYETDLLIGLRTAGAEEGCTLGAMRVVHDGGSATFSQDAEFVIDRGCYELVDSDEVELFVSFDPWNRIGDREPAFDEDAPLPTDFSLYSIAAAAALGVEGCDTCEAAYSLHSNPGLDAQLLQLDTSSTVAVIPVASDDGVEPVDAPRIDFTVSSHARVTGLATGEGLPDGQVQLRHTIRPIGSSDVGMPLTQRRGDQVSDSFALPVPSHGDLVTVSALSIEGQTRDLIIDGSWSNIDEFELVTCLDAEFDQAIYLDEASPRADDCGALPVVIVREPVGQDGPSDPQAGAAGTNSADVWGNTWIAPSAYGFGQSDVTLELWMEMSSTDVPTTTYSGVDINGAGSWFEAGVYAGGHVFDLPFDLVDIYATFIGYEFGGGGVAMGAMVLFEQLIPEFEIQMENGIPLSLAEIFAAAGVDLETSWPVSYPLWGVAFNDGCGTVNAGIWVEGIFEIDQELTTVTARTTTQGVEVEAVINPDIQIEANAGAEVAYSEYIGGAFIAELDVVRVDVPFTGSVEVIDYEPNDHVRLEFEESAVVHVSTLEGQIYFSFFYEFGLCLGIPGLTCFTDDHTHVIASWHGINLFSFPLFVANQVLRLGSDKPSGSWCSANNAHMLAGDFKGDGYLDYLCWRPSDGYRWYDWGYNGYVGTEWTRNTGLCGSGDGSQLVVGDFNGDGRDDLLCHEANSKEIDYANNSGQHASVNWTGNWNWCDASLSDDQTLRAGDYNGDGYDDLFCNRYSDGYYFLNYAESNSFDSSSEWAGDGEVTSAKIRANWNTNKCLNAVGGSTASNGTNVNLWDCSGVSERFDVYFPTDGKIRASWDSDMCVDVSGYNATANGTNIQMYDCDSVSETWVLDQSDNKIHATWDPDVCLDVSGGNTSSNGTNIQIWQCDQVTETWTYVE